MGGIRATASLASVGGRVEPDEIVHRLAGLVVGIVVAAKLLPPVGTVVTEWLSGSAFVTLLKYL